MSDLTTLSDEYAESADFAQAVNSAVLALKKRALGGAGGTVPPADELRGKADELARFVSAILFQLTDDGNTPAKGTLIPDNVIARLEERRGNELPYFLDDLKRARDALAHAGPIGAKELATLDEICDVADAAASASFRRLRRR
jgi:hypothetical protein